MNRHSRDRSKDMAHSRFRWPFTASDQPGTLRGLRHVRLWQEWPLGTAVLFVAQGIALLAVYFLDVNIVPTLLAALCFGLLALLRPDLALLYIPLTVPLYMRTKGIWDAGLGITGVYFPLHEFVILVMAGVSLLYWLARVVRSSGHKDQGTAATGGSASGERQTLEWLPMLLLLVAGIISVLIVPPETRSEARREWRWVLGEPFLVYLLVRIWATNSQARRALIGAIVASGVTVSLVAVLQLAGLDLAPTKGFRPCHSASVVVVGGVPRASSVYCHPNNLGLYLGRIWPLAAALAWESYRRHRPGKTLVYAGVGGLVLLGLLISFSKGALLGACMALLAMVALAGKRRLLAIGVGALALALVLASVAGPDRLNPLNSSRDMRTYVWRSAAHMLRDHPFLGVGLDQFLYYYYNPETGEGYILPEPRAAGETNTAHAHNLVLDLLLRLGVLGLLAYSWLLMLLVRRCVHGWRTGGADVFLSLGLFGATIASLAHGMVDHGYFLPDLAIFFWISLGLTERAAGSVIVTSRRSV